MRCGEFMVMPLVLLLLSCEAAIGGSTRSLGAAVNDPYTMSYEGIEKVEVKNKPLLKNLLESPEVYWANQTEQYEAAGLDFVAPWLKGRSPVQGKPCNTPERLSGLVKALEDRKLTGKITIMPYDDNAASWTAAWNFAEGRGYNHSKPFPLHETNSWAYVWDYNFKAFFDTVPERHLFKIDGRPVIAIWSCSPVFVAGMNGNGSRLIRYMKEQCEKRYGWKPHFRAPEEWLKADPSSTAPGVVDSTAAWFEPKPRQKPYSFSVSRYSGIVQAALIPAFEVNQEFWEPDHGRTLSENLRHTRVEAAADVTLVEGFDNYFEDCALWRARHLTAQGEPIPYDMTGYDYPNQRINILRRYSNDPFPAVLKGEAEWCDEFGGYPGLTNGYRNGPIHLQPSDDPQDPPHGYVVADTCRDQWLRWRDLPLQGEVQVRLRYSTARPGCRVRIGFDDGKPLRVRLPHTGGVATYKEHTAGTWTFPAQSYHALKITFETGDLNLNYWLAERK